jgi:tagaturonate reductase
MQRLNRNTLKDIIAASKPDCGSTEIYPERIIQFGEGNFLRAFADWQVGELNAKGLFKGQVVVVQPIQQGMAAELNAQGGLYTLLMRGVEKGKVSEKRRLVTSISRALNPYEQWTELQKLFQSAQTRFVISNTTEAGIAYAPETYKPGVCQNTFPAKITALLLARYEAFKGEAGKGLVFLPCELIDRNGEKLRQAVLHYAQDWKLPASFVAWVRDNNIFCNTLVDRIVPGYPRAEAAKICSELGYEDKLLVATEHFHLWVIEGPKQLGDELPFAKAGLNVIWTDDMTPYRTRKVRVLNGAHTSSVLAAYATGIDTVQAMVEDPVCGAFLRRAVYEEILPELALPEAEKRAYADSVIERFLNPFVRHELLSISLNSVSKWKVRVLPSLLDSLKSKGRLPAALSFSLAALIWFYRGEAKGPNELRGFRNAQAYPIRDDAPVLEFFAKSWAEARSMTPEQLRALVISTLGQSSFWDKNLNEIPGFTDAVASGLQTIVAYGMRNAVDAVVRS